MAEPLSRNDLQAKFSLAREAAAARDFDRSEALLRDLLLDYPENTRLLNNLARVRLEKSGRIDDIRIVWIASYPRAGSTWLRFLLTNVLHGEFACSSVVNDEVPSLAHGIDESRLRSDQVNFVHVHESYEDFLQNAVDFIDLSAGAIYLARNPIDVLASSVNYILRQSDIDDEREIENRRHNLIESFISGRGLGQWKKVGYGDFVQHFESWAAPNDKTFPIYIVRYEDLKADTVKIISDLCDRFDIDKSADTIMDAARRSSFEAMRKLEAEECDPSNFSPAEDGKYGYLKKSAFPPARSTGRKLGLRFVHKGQSGDGKNLLTREQYLRAADAFRQVSEKLGYKL